MEQNHILLFQFHVVVFLFFSNNNPLNSHCEEKNAIQIHKQATPWIMLFYFNITTKNYDAIIIANKISIEDFISDAGRNLELTNPEMIKPHAKYCKRISVHTHSLLSGLYKLTGQGYKNLD